MRTYIRLITVTSLTFTVIQGQEADLSKKKLEFSKVPIYFEANKGQANSEIGYIGHGSRLIVQVGREGAVFLMAGQRIAMRIVKANPQGRLSAADPVQGVSNYYFGPFTITGLPHWARVRMSDVRPGVDMVYYGSADGLEYDLLFGPGADADALRLSFDGGRPAILADGTLVVRSAGVELLQRVPQVWQVEGARRHVIDCRYKIDEDGKVGFLLGDYDHSAELIVDPILSFSTYIGGNGTDSPAGIAVDSTGVYVTGTTASSNFPVTLGARHDAKGVFVSKFDPTGTSLLYSTVIGGGIAAGIAVDSSQNAYITGHGGVTFPDNGQQLPNGEHAFALKLDSTGKIAYSTLIVGNSAEDGRAIAVDTTGAAYIAGFTYSSSGVATPGAFRTTLSGSADAFVAKFTPTGQLAYATYLGGSGYDDAHAITVDSSGNAYVAGRTESANFPVTAGTYATPAKGNGDAFVSVLNPSGTALLTSTLLGGTSSETATGLARDPAGNLYITGTIDTSIGTGTFDFPTTPGAFVQNGSGPYIFTAKFNPSLSTLVYCGHIAGMNQMPAIAVDASGSAYFTGETQAVNFPTTPGALQRVPLSMGSMFLLVLSPAGDAVTYGTLLDGTHGEQGTAIALDANGGVYLTGGSGSVDFPTTSGAFQATAPKTPSGTAAISGVVAKIDMNSPTACSTNLSSPGASVGALGGGFSFTFSVPAGCPWLVGTTTLGVTLGTPSAGVGAASVMVNGTVPPNPHTSARNIVVYVADKTFTISQDAGSCTLPLVTPQPLQLDSSGAMQNINVVLPQECSWTPVVSIPWLSIGNLDPLGYEVGPRTLTMSASPFGFSTRTTTLTIATHSYTVTQSGSGTCTASAQASLTTAPATGGTGAIRLTMTGTTCGWQAYSLTPWIQLAPNAITGPGSGTIPYSVGANPGSLPRTGQVLVADQIVTITQSAGPAGTITGYSADRYATVLNSVNIGAPYYENSTGNVYFVDSASQSVFVVFPDGSIDTVAGGGTQTGENIPAKTAKLTSPVSVVADSAHNIYIGTGGKVWRVSQGLISSFAGTGIPGFSGDNGPAVNAQISSPLWEAVDPANALYLSDVGNKRIRQITGGVITTFAGGGPLVASDGHPATEAMLAGPNGIVADSAGNIYFADGSAIRQVSQGIIHTLPIIGATLKAPQSLAFDSQGNLLITDISHLYKRTPDGNTAAISLPQVVNPGTGVTADPAGNLYVGGTGVWKLTPVTFCNYVLDQSPISSGAAGAKFTISVTTNSGCNWTASSDLPWVTISAGASGTGSGSVQVSMAANPGSGRSGIIAIAGYAVPVTQLGINDIALALSRSSLNFGVAGSAVTGQQSVTLTLTNGSGVDWTATPSNPNIVVSPSSGKGNATLQISASAGPSGTITVTATGAVNAPQQIQVNVANATAGNPFGSFDTPVDKTTGISGAIAVTGWALDSVEVLKVDIWREPVVNETAGPNGLVYIGDGVFVADARPDVAASFSTTPLNYRAGWGYLMLTNELPGGNGTFKIHAIAHNRSGAAVDLGSKTITVDNLHATKPFGTIDTPAQGGTASGTQYVNFGWALAQNPNCIPTDGSSLAVFVDGVLVGRPVYNQMRSDIATLFPNRCNSNGAVGYFLLDTTKLANGVHTISWLAYDNAANGDGLGSRYFNVFNSGTGPIAEPSDTVSAGPFEEVPRSMVVDELERLELPVGAQRGYLESRAGRLPLPVGSTLRGGVFYWQLGPGFLGDYALVFERADGTQVRVQVTVRPKRFRPPLRVDVRPDRR